MVVESISASSRRDCLLASSFGALGMQIELSVQAARAALVAGDPTP